MLLEGLTGEGSFRAKTDKKDKKGQETPKAFLPLLALLVRFCFSSAFPHRAPPDHELTLAQTDRAINHCAAK
jgi:hypothetical protein